MPRFHDVSMKFKLTLFFMAVGLLPMLLVALLAVDQHDTMLSGTAFKHLESVREIKKNRVEDYFDAKWRELAIVSEIVRHAAAVKQREGVSDNWINPIEPLLKVYTRQFGFHDLFLIKADGTLFSTVEHEADDGSNLLHGAYAGTHFGLLFQKVLKTKRPAITDFAPYAPSHDRPSAFLAQPILHNGEVERVMALQLTLEDINAIMEQRDGLGETGETFLVGQEGEHITYRNDAPVFDKHFGERADPVIGQAVSEKMARTFTVQLSNDYGHGGARIGYEHEDLVSLAPIDLPGLNWSIVAMMSHEEVDKPLHALLVIIVVAFVVLSFVVFFLAWVITRSILQPITGLMHASVQVGEGAWTVRAEAKGSDEIGQLAAAFNKMAQQTEERYWLQTSIAQVSGMVQRTSTPKGLAQQVVSKLSALLSGQHAVLYVLNEANNRYELLGSYGYKECKGLSLSFAEGEGLVGQCVREAQPIVMTDIPEDYVRINSGLGNAKPLTILVFPIVSHGQVLMVLEMASFTPFTPLQEALLEALAPSISLGLENQNHRLRTEALLKKTQTQADTLLLQQEELTQTNNELQRQAQDLRASEEELKAQREELEVQHEQLTKTNTALRESSASLQQKQKELEVTSLELKKKADTLEKTSRYKTDFFANISHELRTPLNSLLVFARLLKDNPQNNLTEKQVDAVSVIHDSGHELLVMINDLLDLAKAESGKMDVVLGTLWTVDFADKLRRQFTPVAEEKGLTLTVTVAEDVPERVYTDESKVGQIVKNFISNACKFTDAGHVSVRFASPPSDRRLSDDEQRIPTGDLSAEKVLSISIEDTGIGIPDVQKTAIFEQFRQADSSTSRRYGGTGLGLSIVQALTTILHGEIRLCSTEGKGSLFTLFLPDFSKGDRPQGTDESKPSTMEQDSAKRVDLTVRSSAQPSSEDTKMPPGKEPEGGAMAMEAEETIPDDRHTITPGDRILLVIEDNLECSALVGGQIRARGFKWLATGDGRRGLALAQHHHPVGILLNLEISGMDGWEVLSRLKEDVRTRHIPVHVISGLDHNRLTPMIHGAVACWVKPMNVQNLNVALDRFESFLAQDTRQLLVVEDDIKTQKAIVELLGSTQVAITAVDSGEAALKALASARFDCMVLDLGLPDMDGIEVLEHLVADKSLLPKPPVIIYSARDLSREDYDRLRPYIQAIVIKGARSPARLLDEVALYLHSEEQKLPEPQHAMLRTLRSSLDMFHGKTMLIADDDMRSAYALSQVLESRGVQTFMASNGIKALAQLEQHPGMDSVLMDIMMPGMDGLQAIRKIREQPRFARLPIVVLSARSSIGDREAAMRVGADDFLTKPVDADRLFSILRTRLQW